MTAWELASIALLSENLQSEIAPVLAGMLELQRRGYGQAKAIPSIEMAATGIDSVIAITGAYLSHAARKTHFRAHITGAPHGTCGQDDPSCLWLFEWLCSCSCRRQVLQLQASAWQCAGFAVASGIAIPSGTGVMEKLHGPLIVVFGIAAALIGGLLCRCSAQSLNRDAQCAWLQAS